MVKIAKSFRTRVAVFEGNGCPKWQVERLPDNDKHDAAVFQRSERLANGDSHRRFARVHGRNGGQYEIADV